MIKKLNITYLLLAIGLLVNTATSLAATSSNCEQLQQENGYPSYYCDCKENATAFKLPIDTIIFGSSIWYVGTAQELSNGISAYLHSDCDLDFKVYMGCGAIKSVYQAFFEQNKANSVDAESIKRKLEENYVGESQRFYICISPIVGQGGRLIMRKQNDGMPSTCDDPLYIFPGMSLYTTRTNDVYVFNPQEQYDLTDVIIEWVPDTYTPCNLLVTRGACDGPTVAQLTMQADDLYILPAQHVRQAHQNNELLYFHFSHAAKTAGMINCLIPEYEENYTEITLCQGKGLQVNDTLLTEPTVYTIDTVHLYDNFYQINFYDLMFSEPEVQYDTLAFQYTHQPYLYRGQHTISKPGDYDLTIHTPGACDERYLLHVYHDRDTIVSVADTSLCYGSSFKYQGKLYSQDVSFGQAVWKNQDTLLLDSLHVRFASSPEIVYDTIMQNQNKYGKTYKQPGEFRFTYTNPTTYCVDSIILLVKPNSDLNIQYDYYYIDTTLCQGMEYEDYYGNLYATSTVLYDTIWRIPNKHCEIEITTITFTEPEIQHDTISLKTTQLPYKYNKYCTVDTFDLYDYTVHVDGRCDERYQLLVCHDIDTIYQNLDTTICQGKSYTYEGVKYTTDITLVDTLQLDADTYQILTTNVLFTAPEITPDTLALKTTDLPYTYRNQYVVDDFGMHDVLISLPDVCDEHYALYVWHDLDTITASVDTVLCQGIAYVHNGVVYTTSTTLVDTLQLDADTYQILTTNVLFTAPEITPDTLALKTADLPYTYRNQYVVDDFGEHDVLISLPDVCDEHYALYVWHDVDTIVMEIDTFLCYGNTFIYDNIEYVSDTTLVFTKEAPDTWEIENLNIYFSKLPEQVYDTITLAYNELPYLYRDQYEVTSYGDHEFELKNSEGCVEWMLLHVLGELPTALIEQNLKDQPQLILQDGIVYIVRGKERYTLLGERL